MLQVRYERDLQKNYLIIEGIEKTSHNYQNIMIQENSINGLLPFTIRRIDEEIFYYYDISGKQCVQNLFQRKAISYEELRTILLELHQLIEEVKSYLIDSSHIILDPNYLYCDYECKKLFCVYQIDYDMEQKVALEGLAEYLVEHVDSENEEAVDMAYDFYQSVRKENFSFPYFLELLQNRNKEHMNHEIVNQSTNPIEQIIDTEVEVPMQIEKNQVKKIFLLKLAIVVFAVLMVGMYVHIACPDYTAEAIGLYGMAAFILAGGMTYYYLGARTLKNKKEEEKETPFCNASVLEDIPINNRMEQDPLDSGETVCLQVAPKEQRILRGEVKNAHVVYPIVKLPCMIGKSQELVDFPVDDPSISRIHAEIIEGDDGLYLRDLNSTNGTFKNGIILETNELVKLCIRDEIQIGEIYLEYR